MDYWLHKKQMTVANRSRISVTNCGKIKLQLSIHLKNVLHIPQLFNNIFSTQKLTEDLNCAITIFHFHYFFWILPWEEVWLECLLVLYN
jgi:hypothetical protein